MRQPGNRFRVSRVSVDREESFAGEANLDPRKTGLGTHVELVGEWHASGEGVRHDGLAHFAHFLTYAAPPLYQEVTRICLHDLHNTTRVSLCLQYDKSDATFAPLGRSPPRPVEVFLK